MKVLTPIFYDDFKCSADKCTYNCCCTDWGIVIDTDTYKKYEEMGITKLYDCFEKDNKGNVKFKFTAEYCPFLNEQGMCSLVIKYGPDILCDICELFPRIRTVRGDNLEVGLSNACIEVLHYLNRIKPPLSFSEDEIDMCLEGTPINELAMCYRDSAIDILQLQEIPLWARLYIIYMYSQKIDLHQRDKTKSYMEKYASMDYLKELHQQYSKLDVPLDYKIQATFELFFELSSKVGKMQGDVRYIIPILEYVNQTDVNTLIGSWYEFNDYFQYTSTFFENFCVNYMFIKGIGEENEYAINSRAGILLMEMSLIRFALFLLWHRNGKRLSEKDILGISCYYARIFEHGFLEQITNAIAEIGDGDWFSPSQLFVLIR